MALPDYECIKCLCHTVSGCWLRRNCARYSINKDYWQKAGSLSPTDQPKNENQHFHDCMNNENCIVGTILEYTIQFGQLVNIFFTILTVF